MSIRACAQRIQRRRPRPNTKDAGIAAGLTRDGRRCNGARVRDGRNDFRISGTCHVCGRVRAWRFAGPSLGDGHSKRSLMSSAKRFGNPYSRSCTQAVMRGPYWPARVPGTAPVTVAQAPQLFGDLQGAWLGHIEEGGRAVTVGVRQALRRKQAEGSIQTWSGLSVRASVVPLWPGWPPLGLRTCRAGFGCASGSALACAGRRWRAACCWWCCQAPRSALELGEVPQGRVLPTSAVPSATEPGIGLDGEKRGQEDLAGRRRPAMGGEVLVPAKDASRVLGIAAIMAASTARRSPAGKIARSASWPPYA